MKSRLKLVIVLATVTCSLSGANDPDYQLSDDTKKWHGTANAVYRGGDSRHIGQLGFTFPVAQSDDALLFLDFRGRIDDQETEEFNLGFAYRKILPSDWIFGVYGFFDRNTTGAGNVFDQGTVGFEFLSEDWDFRVNGYLPDLNGQDAGLSSGFGQISTIGNQFFMDTRRVEERAYYGGDYEIGKRLAVFGENENELRIFGGGYYFDNDAPGYAYIAGARVRLETRLFDVPLLGEGSRVTLTGDVQWDPVRETEGFGGIAIQIPIGKYQSGGSGFRNPFGANARYAKLNSLERRMYDPIIRDIDVVTQATAVGNGADLLLDEEGDALTLANAAFSLDKAISDAGDDGSVVVSGAVTSTGSTLLPGQRLISATATQTVVGSESGIRVTGPLPGTQGVISGGAAAPLVTLAKKNIVDSLEFRGGSNGILGNNVGESLIRNNSISGALNDGLKFDGDFTGMLLGNTSFSNGGSGFRIMNNLGTISGNSSSMNNPGSGFSLEYNRGIISGNTAYGNRRSGIFVAEDNEGTISGNTVSENAYSGIEVFDRNTGSITGNTAFGHDTLLILGFPEANSGNGIHVADNDGLISENVAYDNSIGILARVGEGRTINNQSYNNDLGLGFVFTNFGAIISGNVTFGNGINGIRVRQDHNGIITRNVSSNNGGNGISVKENIGQITLNTLTNNLGDGLNVETNTVTGTISDNVATGNTESGFEIITTTPGGTVINNTSSGNGLPDVNNP